jgi:hypothetical protein
MALVSWLVGIVEQCLAHLVEEVNVEYLLGRKEMKENR